MPDDTPRKANIQTLEIPAETPEITTSDLLDPFGNEVEPEQNDPEEKPDPEATTTAEMTAENEFDPFGPEAETTELTTTTPTEIKPATELVETESDPFTNIPEVKPSEVQPDPFATAPDPFSESESKPEPEKSDTEPPSLDFALSEPEPEETIKPVKTVEANPFGEVESDPTPFPAASSEEKKTLEAESGNPVAITPGNSFQEPLPLLEPVPDQNLKSPQTDPFGEFETVPAGAAQASSITQVSPESANLKRSGTLADLEAPTSANLSTDNNSSPFDDIPFATPQPKPAANEFKRNPDGTYEIRQGDSYWIISRKAYGSSRYYRALAEYNRKVIANPQQMTAGKKIAVPPVQELELKLSHLIPEGSRAPSPAIVVTSAERESGFFTDQQGNPMYRIQENDTLTGISQRHLGRSSRWIQIYELNRDKLANPNQLKIGTMLKLPGDASRVRIVRGK